MKKVTTQPVPARKQTDEAEKKQYTERMLIRNEIRTISDAGHNAVSNLVERLCEQIAQQHSQITQ
jgi:hypothetical protein